MLIRRAEIHGARDVDVEVGRGVVTRVGRPGERLARRPGADRDELDAAGGALIPGLHDHHVHLMSTAAARASVRLGPPEVTDVTGFAAALRAAANDARGAAGPVGTGDGTDRAGRSPGWVRGIGYHPSVAGDLDRWMLDALAPGVPVRVQHRGGALWVLSSEALRRVGAGDADPPGIERDPDGTPTGRLWRLDGWLSSLVPRVSTDLAAVGRDAAAHGIIGLTDATPDRRPAETGALVAAAARGDLPQRLTLMRAAAEVQPDRAGRPDALGDRCRPGPMKIMLDDRSLPHPDDLAASIQAAHRIDVPVAVHCVTRVQAVVTLAALAQARSASEPGGPDARPGGPGGDRIEHGAVLPPDLADQARALRVTVVTQPNFVAERGDRYLADVDPDDLKWLYPCGSLRRAGVSVAAGTDAPFGQPDPWRAIRAAIDRRTHDGRVLGAVERLTGGEALDLFLGTADAPGHPRRIQPGAAADLCLLQVPLDAALADPHAGLVAATMVDGTVVHRSR